MRGRFIPAVLVSLVAFFWGCGGGDEAGGPGDGARLGAEFVLLTYNVAGLPNPLSGSNPEVNIPQISPLLNNYDLVVVQEDFWYHRRLVKDTQHPYRSEPMWQDPDAFHMGDGLNRFSMFPLGGLERITWADCNGMLDCSSDCLTTKGFSVSGVDLAEGLTVDLYNLHMDAGGCPGDIEARRIQAEQLLAEILARSGGRAVIVAGDTNLKASREEDMASLDLLLSGADLADSCRFLGCPYEVIDRVLFRGSESLLLEPLSWWFPPEFVDHEGEDLSDHKPVAVRFRWEAGP